jgi:hypothetical protein
MTANVAPNGIVQAGDVIAGGGSCRMWSSPAFDVPFGHLALDEAWVGAVPSHRVQASAELDDGVAPEV